MPGLVYVTGVNGTVGRHVAERLVAAGIGVLGSGLEPSPGWTNPLLTYEQLDLTDFDAVSQMLRRRRPDVVLHFAALVHVRDSRLTFGDYCRVNYYASENLFKCAVANGATRLLLASTIEVYGITPAGAHVDESYICRPDSDYARSKVLAEDVLRRVATSTSVAHAVLRFAPVYGPAFRLNLDKRILLKRPTIGYRVGDGNYRLNFCSLENIDFWISRWLQSPSPATGVFNLADATSYTANDLLELERQLGQLRHVVTIPALPSISLLGLRRAALELAGRDPGMLSPENFRKLLRSTRWDVRRAEAASGPLPGDIRRDLFGGKEAPAAAWSRSSRHYETTKRLVDFGVATTAVATLAVPLALTALAVRTTSKGPIVYWSRRIGKNNSEFLMPKFRTMRIDTPQVATHLLTDSNRYVTPVGRVLRRTSLDELPQLWSILKGDMSFVGPRPALFNQDDLIQLRTEKGVHELVPGLTGWAQVNGRDELPIPVKVEFDAYYREKRSLSLDAKILALTVWKALTGEGVQH